MRSTATECSLHAVCFGVQPGLLQCSTYVRCWAGLVYMAFILDVFAQRIVAWHAHTKHVELVMIPLRIAL